jgi:hypothetical protein
MATVGAVDEVNVKAFVSHCCSQLCVEEKPTCTVEVNDPIALRQPFFC